MVSVLKGVGGGGGVEDVNSVVSAMTAIGRETHSCFQTLPLASNNALGALDM